MKLFGVLLLTGFGSLAEKPRPRQMLTVAVKNVADRSPVVRDIEAKVLAVSLLSNQSREELFPSHLWPFCFCTNIQPRVPFLYLARGVCKIRILIGFFLFVLKTGTSVFK